MPQMKKKRPKREKLKNFISKIGGEKFYFLAYTKQALLTNKQVKTILVESCIETGVSFCWDSAKKTKFPQLNWKSFTQCSLLDLIMLRLFKKKFYCKCKIQISLIEDQNVGHGDRMAEAWKGSERRGEGFAGLGGYSVYQKAPGCHLTGFMHPLPPLQHYKFRVTELNRRNETL